MRSHRGHRLGLLLKTDMNLWLREVQPQIAEISHLERRVERPHDRRQRLAIGYRVVGRELEFQKAL